MLDPHKILGGIPNGLRVPLVSCYEEIARNYAEHRWEPSELNGGKFCEVVYTILDGATSGTYASAPFKPAKMVDACRALEKRPANSAQPGDHSLRILVPRILPFLYDIRNNRGVGHVGGDVDPNYSDATAVFSGANWILAELVRVFHGVTLQDAQTAVDALVERRHPVVWEIEKVKRVLDPTLGKSDQALLLVYATPGWTSEADLRSWVEYKNPTDFRRKVLAPLHRDRLLEFDQGNSRVRITPRGAKKVEDQLLPAYR